MGIFNFFRKKPNDMVVVFGGNRIEAELVMNLLREEGFHPSEWADTPASYIGMAGVARVVVPLEEGDPARRFLDALKETGRLGELEEPGEKGDFET